MSLDKLDTVDAIGTETDSGIVILTIADAWDWTDVDNHLLALQAKVNKYIEFIETGQIYETYPLAIGRRLAVDLITRYPLPGETSCLMHAISRTLAQLNVEFRQRVIP